MNRRIASPAALPSHDHPAGHNLALRPAWSVLGLLVGTALAVALVPTSGHYLPGALTPAALALSAGLLFGPVVSGMRHPVTAFRAEHLLMLGLVCWLLLDAGQAGPRLWDVAPPTVQLVFALTGAFAACLWIGSALTSLLIQPRTHRLGMPDVGPSFLFLAGVVCAVFGFARPIVTCQFSLGCLAEAVTAPRFAVPWYSGPGIKGLNTLLLSLRYFGYLTLPILVALLMVERRVSWRAVALAPLTLAFLVLLLRDGGRREFGSVIAVSMLVWIFLQPRLRPRHYALILGGAAGVLLLMQVMLTWRDIGVANVLDSDRPQPTRSFMVDRSLDWLAHLVEVVPERAPHTGWSGVAYVVGYPIPTSVWKSKPVHRGLNLPSYIGRAYGPGFSWTYTAIGDLYLIGGLLAVIAGGLLYGVLANFTSRLLFRPPTVWSRLAYALIVMTLFLTLRALTEFAAQGLTVLALGALLATHWFISRTFRPLAA